MIPHNKPSLDNKEVEAVTGVINSKWLAQGKEVQAFEKDFCKFLYDKGGFAVAVSSGTAALYLALVALGVEVGDEIIVPTYVCSAVLNAVLFSGTTPIIVDINEDDLNISLAEAKRKINKNTKAIIITHTFGMPAKIKYFLKLGLPIIEDCAQALGSSINDRRVGTFGKISVFSFYASKVITTGYGGMVFTKDRRLTEKLMDYREFDLRRVYVPRFNFQLSDINAAIGRVQLKKLPRFLKKRADIAKIYSSLLGECGWPNNLPNGRVSNYSRFLVRSRKVQDLKRFLELRNIKTIVPIQMFELLHRYLKLNPKEFPASEAVAKTTLSLPIYPGLLNSEISLIKKSLMEFNYK